MFRWGCGNFPGGWNGSGTTEKENQRHLQRKCKKEERGRKGTCIPSEHRKPRVDKCEYFPNKQNGEGWEKNSLLAKEGEEIETGILDSPISLAYEQAENRMHSQTALLFKLYK